MTDALLVDLSNVTVKYIIQRFLEHNADTWFQWQLVVSIEGRRKDWIGHQKSKQAY